MNDNSFPVFNKIYQILYSTKNINNTIDLLRQSLNSYLNQINSELIFNISTSIINNYLNNKKKINSQILYKLIVGYSKKEIKLLKYNLMKWNKINLKIKSSDNSFYTNNCSNIFYSNNNSSRYYNNNNYNNNCNNNNNNINYQKNIQKLNLSNINNNQINNNNKNSNYIESPYTNCNNSNLNNIENNEYKSNNILSQVSPNFIVDKFIHRQEDYAKITSLTRKKIQKDNEDEYNQICTFNPKVNQKLRSLYKESKSPAHLRLYNDSIDRQIKQIENENLFYNNYNYCYKPNRKVDQNKIEELYNEYKLKDLKTKKLTNKIDKENGCTFMPEINKKAFKRKFNGRRLSEKKSNNYNNNNNNKKFLNLSNIMKENIYNMNITEKKYNNSNINLNNSMIVNGNKKKMNVSNSCKNIQVFVNEDINNNNNININEFNDNIIDDIENIENEKNKNNKEKYNFIYNFIANKKLKNNQNINSNNSNTNNNIDNINKENNITSKDNYYEEDSLEHNSSDIKNKIINDNIINNNIDTNDNINNN